MKIHWYLLKLSSGNENTDGQTDAQMHSQHDAIIPHHYCIVGYKKEKFSVW